jgi:hypothetical protein
MAVLVFAAAAAAAVVVVVIFRCRSMQQLVAFQIAQLLLLLQPQLPL